jgi:hypothetical protein
MESRTLINTFYLVETILKGLFLVMSPLNLRWTLTAAFFASLIGVIRVLKRPQFNKEYLAKFFMNNHGQNLFYIAFGALGFINYLYYAPIALFFFYGIAEYINMKFPTATISQYTAIIRHHRFYIMEGRCRIEMAFLAYLILTLPLDFMNRLIKVFMIAQYLLIKYRINNEFRYASSSVNSWIEGKISGIGFVLNGYKKLAGIVHDYANRQPEAAPAAPAAGAPAAPHQ